MKLQLTDDEVKHLRLVLGWMRCEFCLDENMQRGTLDAIKELLDAGEINEEKANFYLTQRSDQIRQVPKYVRHGIKMLSGAVKKHDGTKGDIVDSVARTVALIER